MQKKILWGVAALVLLFVFAGCSQPTDFTYSGASPGNPGELSADTTYEGLILLSWRGVANASKYQVYRYDPVTKKERFLGDVAIATPNGATQGDLYYADFVGRENQLEDGRRYEYTVVAVNNSFNQSGLPLKNGKSKITAQAAKIPAEGTALPAPAFEPEITSGGGSIVVKIPNQPNLDYDVKYQYGGGELVGRLTSSTATPGGDSWIFEKTRYLTFPSFEGKGVVTVEYSFAGPSSSYYKDGTLTPQNIDIPIGADKPGAITNFAVFRDEDTVSPYTRYEWRGGAGATSFEIYKAPVNANLPSSLTGGTIRFLDDWVKVTTTPPEQDNSQLWVAKEIAETNTINYVYAIKAVNDAGKTDPVFGYRGPAILPVPTLNVTTRYDADDEIQISWLGDEDAEYHLYRAVADPLTGNSGTTSTANFVLRDPGEYEEVIFEKPRYVLGWAVIVDKPEGGEAYVYKLIAKKWGATSAPAIEVINTPGKVFTNQVNFSIAQITDDYKTQNNAFDALSVVITYLGHDTLIDRARTIKLYRRVSGAISDGSASPYELRETFNWPADASGKTLIYNDKVPDVSLAYNYRIVVTNPGSTVEVPNFQASGTPPKTETPDVRPYSYDYVLNQNLHGNNNGKVLFQNISVLPETNKTLQATGAATWSIPPSGIIIDIGSKVVLSPTNTQYSGPSIEGLKVRFGWGVHDGGVPGDQPTSTGASTYQEAVKELTIQRLSADLTNTPGQDQTTTYYVYYIVLDPASSHATNARRDEPTWGAYNDPQLTPPGQYNDDWIVVKSYPWTSATKPVNASDKLGYYTEPGLASITTNAPGATGSGKTGTAPNEALLVTQGSFTNGTISYTLTAGSVSGAASYQWLVNNVVMTATPSAGAGNVIDILGITSPSAGAYAYNAGATTYFAAGTYLIKVKYFTAANAALGDSDPLYLTIAAPTDYELTVEDDETIPATSRDVKVSDVAVETFNLEVDDNASDSQALLARAYAYVVSKNGAAGTSTSIAPASITAGAATVPIALNVAPFTGAVAGDVYTITVTGSVTNAGITGTVTDSKTYTINIIAD